MQEEEDLFVSQFRTKCLLQQLVWRTKRLQWRASVDVAALALGLQGVRVWAVRIRGALLRRPLPSSLVDTLPPAQVSVLGNKYNSKLHCCPRNSKEQMKFSRPFPSNCARHCGDRKCLRVWIELCVVGEGSTQPCPVPKTRATVWNTNTPQLSGMWHK